MSSTTRVAALFVDAKGPYSDPAISHLVDLYTIDRDARLYTGPYPVVAHPPCERWGRYWAGNPRIISVLPQLRHKKGDDGGCFESALRSVMLFGGVIEHPEASHAWNHFGINRPHYAGGWYRTLVDIRESHAAWTCCVEQGHYGHISRKMTWLFYYNPYSEAPPPELRWGRSKSAQSSARTSSRSPTSVEWISTKKRKRTPIEFRDLLISLAQSCTPGI